MICSINKQSLARANHSKQSLVTTTLIITLKSQSLLDALGVQRTKSNPSNDQRLHRKHVVSCIVLVVYKYGYDYDDNYYYYYKSGK